MTTLLIVDSDVGCIVQDQWTPLHFAVQFGQVETVKLLVAAGANCNAVSRVSAINRTIINSLKF